MIVALSSLIGRQVAIRPKAKDDQFEVIPNLWGALVANPGSKKTATMEGALKPLYQLIDNAKAEYQEQMSEFKQKEIELQLQIDQLDLDYQNKKISMDRYAKEKAELQSKLEDDKPIEKRYMVNDTTTEKMVEIHKDNPNGLLVYREELIGLFSSLNKKGREEDRAFYLQSWTGTQPFEVDRINRRNLYLPHL